MAVLNTVNVYQKILEYHCKCSLQLPVCIRMYVCIYSGLKNLITPILAGLLENNPDKMMEFDQFFYRISKIAQMKVSLYRQLTLLLS